MLEHSTTGHPHTIASDSKQEGAFSIDEMDAAVKRLGHQAKHKPRTIIRSLPLSKPETDSKRLSSFGQLNVSNICYVGYPSTLRTPVDPSSIKWAGTVRPEPNNTETYFKEVLGETQD